MALYDRKRSAALNMLRLNSISSGSAAAWIAQRQRRLVGPESCAASASRSWLKIGIGGRAIGRGAGSAPRSSCKACSPSNGVSGSDRLLRIGHAIQYDRVSRLGIAPHVELRHARAVGGGVKIDLLDSRAPGAPVRDRRPPRCWCSSARDRPNLFKTGERRLAQLRHLLADFLPVIRVAAGERRRSARAALIDQHDVVIAVDPGERARVAHVQVRGRLARAAREQKQRRRRGAAVERGYDRDAQDRWHGRPDARGPPPPGAEPQRAATESSLKRMLEAALVQGQRGRRTGRRAASAPDEDARPCKAARRTSRM